MISIIVCSVDSVWREKLKTNIDKTIGVDYEFIYKDNISDTEGICTIYNKLAAQAKGDFLCFVHEDVLFDTQDWGVLLQNKAKEPDCGVIGFAGAGTVVGGAPFWFDIITAFYHYIQRDKKGNLISDATTLHTKGKYEKVISLDGMCLFCRKKVWQDVMFDEVTFPGFHMYDADFTIAASLRYINYVCFEVVICHFSEGSKNKEFFESLIIFYEKWKHLLPYTIYPQRYKKRSGRLNRSVMRWLILDIYRLAGLSPKYILNYLITTRRIHSLYTLIRAFVYIPVLLLNEKIKNKFSSFK